MVTYLDHNATTPLDERVLEAMLPWLTGRFGNPSSLHALGRDAREAIGSAREQVALLVGAHPTQVVFTSGGTEANNAAMKGAAAGRSPGRMAVSAIEHASVMGPSQALRRAGWEVVTLPVDAAGRVERSALERLAPDTQLVSVLWANNETGVIQDVGPIGEMCRARGFLLHTDAVQAAGKIAVDFCQSGAHLMTLSAHKIYGPKGAGALIVDKAVELAPLVDGGGQERGYRCGTENVAAIVGFGRAAELAASELEQRRGHLAALRVQLENRLATELPHAVVFGAKSGRLPNTAFFAIPGIEGQTLVLGLDRQGIAVSSGSACGSSHTEPSHVLKAMGVPAELARCAIRVSFGSGNTGEDVERLVSALKRQVEQLAAFAALAW